MLSRGAGGQVFKRSEQQALEPGPNHVGWHREQHDGHEWNEHCDDQRDEILEVDRYRTEGTARSVALEGNAADLLPELVRRGLVPDVLTDQTSAHDALAGYVPQGLALAEADTLRRSNPDDYIRRAIASMAVHVRAMLDLQARGAVTFDYGNNIRAQARKGGVENAFDIPGFVPEYIRPLFCEGKGPFRWAALSGDAADIAATDRLALEMFSHDEALCRWIRR